MDSRGAAPARASWGRLRNHDGGAILQRIHQQPRINKLVREEHISLIVEDGSCFYGPRRSVNLVVQRQQLPACNLRLRSAIKGIDREHSLLAQSSCNWA